uniref:FABP domain-containing protein n=1 Tax=Trichobilharzia regenti TaxID=157069 RepID=A0AA85K6A6_TRIRE|nr:unnamed protein product [Trichobilharzia regenti]
MSAFVGSWKLVEMTNFKALLDKVYVDERIRQAIMNHRPKVTYRLIGNDGMEIKTESEMGANVMTFKYGVEFTQDTGFLSTPKTVIRKLSENAIEQTQQHSTGIVKVLRTVEGDKMTVNVSMDDVEGVQIFERL